MAKVTFAFGDYLSLLCKFSPLLRASLVAKTVKILPTIQETWVIQSLGQEDSLGKEMATHSNILV